MNKLLIGLCAAALTMGGVSVGAVALNHHAEEAKAENVTTIYFKDAGWWATDSAITGYYTWGTAGTKADWPGENMTLVSDSLSTSGGNIWKVDLDLDSYQTIVFTRRDNNGSGYWNSKTVDISLAAFDSAKPMYDISGTTAVYGGTGATGNWVAYEEPEPTPVIANGTYLVGTHNSWTADSNSIGATDHGTDKAAWENIELAAAVEFKLRVVQSGSADAWLGYDQIAGGSNYVTKNTAESEDYNNIIVNAAGHYNIYLNASNEIYISMVDTTPDGIYMVGTHNSWNPLAEGAATGVVTETEHNQGEWKAVSLAKDVEFKLRVRSGGADTYYGFDALAGGTGQSKFVVSASDNNFKVDTAGTYSIYLTKSGEVYIDDDNYVPDVPANDGYYICGNATFTGNEATAWKYSGATKLGDPDDGSSDKAKGQITVGVGTELRARSYLSSTDTWLEPASPTGYTFATVNGSNYVFTKAGTYTFYINENDQLWVTGEAGHPIVETDRVYISTGNYGDGHDLYVYTWDDETHNAEFPGEKITEMTGVSCTDGLNFNSAGGIYEIPATSLKDKFIISVYNGEAKVVQTGDIAREGGLYVNPTLGTEHTGTTEIIASEAYLAKAIVDKINATEHDSVCEVIPTDAKALVEKYDELHSDTDVIDAATYWTYESTSMAAKTKNVTIAKMIPQLRISAAKVAPSAWAFKDAVDENNLTPIIITIVSITLASALAVYLLSKKRRG
ncbi:MAG: hypothetical protein K5694_05665 [Bacilli bacterium]|nr:hypothetical protein [Bacilli bacterium]